MFPSWLASSASESDDDADARDDDDVHRARSSSPNGARGSERSRLRAIGTTVKHEAKDRLGRLVKSDGASKAVDAVTRFIVDQKSHGANERVDALKARTKALWTNALRDDEEKIERAKNVTTAALEITERLALSADPEGEVAHTFADAARRMKGIVQGSKNREEALELSKTLGKDVWEKLS